MIERLTATRRDLHQIPEIGFDLPQTQAYLVNALKETGARIEETRPSGILAFFDGGKNETCAFRADMDALPGTEAGGDAFCSRHPGRMHACGHDCHMAMLLELARYVKDHLPELPRNVLLVFEPAEEGGGGARMMTETGFLRRYRVASIAALHVMPGYPEGALCSRPGPLMSQSSEMRFAFTGKSVHIARWREGSDALLAAADFLTRAYRMAETCAPDAFKLLRFGMLRAGEAVNVVANRAELGGTLRAFDAGVFEDMRRKLSDIARETEAVYGVKADLSYTTVYPVLNNDPAFFERARGALGDLPFVPVPEPSLISEDFSVYLQAVPGAMFWLGLGDTAPLHATNFRLDEKILENGVKALIRWTKMA